LRAAFYFASEYGSNVVGERADAREARQFAQIRAGGADEDTACLTSVKLVISNPKASFERCVYQAKEKVSMRVAFLGLGIMGQSMAANLVKAGHEVTVWNRTPGKLVEGAGVAPSPAAAAQGAEVVWLCVSDTDAVEEVIFGKDGAESSVTRGAIVADSSTISPLATVKFAERLAAKGVAWVDAPMTGSKIGARDGTLVFIVGGAEEPIERLKPLFAAMGKKIFRMGETGKGQATKLAMNLQIALIYEGFAEALTLATKLGIDTQQLLSLIEATMVRSGVVDYKGPFVLQRDFTPNFPLRLMHKDIRLALEAAKEVRVKLPGLETVEEIYEMATEDGNQDLDYAATLTLLEKWAGVRVKGKAA
jgi:3-hydroxyisobutyrate dehydrogenase-like beta-hydroxyacid dehydrogenase